MKDDLGRKLSLGDLAQEVEMSVSHLMHLFKAETGMPPTRYRRQLRIERAQELLATTILSVKQIRNSVGMEDRRYFEREFKKVCNVTPTAYRAAALGSAKKSHP